MTDKKIDPGLLKLADQLFWDEFYQAEKHADRYIVIDSKNSQVVAQNVKLVQGMKKVKV